MAKKILGIGIVLIACKGRLLEPPKTHQECLERAEKEFWGCKDRQGDHCLRDLRHAKAECKELFGELTAEKPGG